MTEGEGTLRYSTTVTKIGQLVEDFAAKGMLILFADGAPEELHDFCVLHSAQVTVGGIRPGDVLQVGDVTMSILAVGQVAEANLAALGHVSFKATGAAEAQLPGDICLEQAVLPPLQIGTRIHIVAGAQAQTERTS